MPRVGGLHVAWAYRALLVTLLAGEVEGHGAVMVGGTDDCPVPQEKMDHLSVS